MLLLNDLASAKPTEMWDYDSKTKYNRHQSPINTYNQFQIKKYLFHGHLANLPSRNQSFLQTVLRTLVNYQ